MARPNESANLAKLFEVLPELESHIGSRPDGTSGSRPGNGSGLQEHGDAGGNDPRKTDGAGSSGPRKLGNADGGGPRDHGMLVTPNAIYIAYPRLSELMGCSPADARRTVEHLCEAEVEGETLGIYPIGSAEDLAEWSEGSDAPFSEQQAERILGWLGGPFAIVESCPKLLQRQPRLTADESWALLEALDRAGVGQDIPFVQELQRAVMSEEAGVTSPAGKTNGGRNRAPDGETRSSRSHGGDGHGGMQASGYASDGSLAEEAGGYAVASKLSLLCSQHRKAKIAYDPVFHGAGREAGGDRPGDGTSEPGRQPCLHGNAGPTGHDATDRAAGAGTSAAQSTCGNERTGATPSPAMDSREVLPIEVFRGENGEMYLFAYQYAIDDGSGWKEAQGALSFKIDRIASVEPLAGHERDPEILSMERPESLVPESGEIARIRLADGTDFDGRVWLHAKVIDSEEDAGTDVPEVCGGEATGGNGAADIATGVADGAPEDSLDSNVPDGDGAARSRTIELPLLEDTSWIARSIASKLGGAEVLEPASLRAEVAATAQQALDEMDTLAREFGEG